MTFQIQRSSNPGLRPRESRNENTIVLLALLPDPLGKNPSDAAIRRYAERIDRAFAGLAPKRSAARRRQRFAGDFLLGSISRRACRSAAKKAGGLVNNKRNTSAAALQRTTPLDPKPDDLGGNDGRDQSTFQVLLGAALQQAALL